MREGVTPRARDLFLEALDRQNAKGFETYGVPLTTFNGHDAGQMCLEELADAVQYLTQLRMENDFLKAFILSRCDMTCYRDYEVLVKYLQEKS